MELNEDSIKTLLMDKDIIKKHASFKVALTRFYADKMFFGAIAVFIRYLIEKESYLSFSDEYLFGYV